MKLILSHPQPDFDALAGLALARLLHPGAVAVKLGNLNEGVEAFVHLYRDVLTLVDAADIELDEVEELIVVDTSDPGRIAPFDRLIGKVPITLYDHHPQGASAVPAARGLHQPVGATASILTLLLKSKGIAISPELASLALLGIHEDTGKLTYAGTQAEDFEAAAHLLRSGANLAFVNEFLDEPYGPEHRDFLKRLLDAAEEHTVTGYRVIVSSLEREDYLAGVSPLCTELLELHDAEAALVVAEMDGKTVVIARAKGGSFDMDAVLAETLGGGGHPSAAFARTELPREEALQQVLAALGRFAARGKLARDLMSAPVKTVRAESSIAEAQELLVRFGHNGLPVLDEDGALVGIISRRDLERALRHDLGRSEVRGFMTQDVVTATPETSQRELERLVQKHNIGRIPVLEGGKLVGIVTRTDLLAERHLRGHQGLSPEARAVETVLGSLPGAAEAALASARELVEDGALYLVGGCVRDALLRVGVQDIDLVVEGDDAARLGAAMQARLGGSMSCHLAFGTCTLSLPGGLVLDLATAREEYYTHPGALPEVAPSTLHKDLARRDFTVNALAVRLTPEPAVLLDPFGGLSDLENRLLRSLHPLSFVEDPTRILRGARLAGRLGLRLHPDTEAQMKGALTKKVVDKVSASRLRAELELTLAEARVLPALALLDRLGALGTMFGLELDEALIAELDAARRTDTIPDESYLLALLLSVPPARQGRVRERFHWPRRTGEMVESLRLARATATVGEETLENSGEAFRTVLKALGPELRARVEGFEQVPKGQKLRGQDVLDLGLPPGPAVGEILRDVAEARAQKRVTSLDEELELARRLVRQKLESNRPESNARSQPS